MLEMTYRGEIERFGKQEGARLALERARQRDENRMSGEGGNWEEDLRLNIFSSKHSTWNSPLVPPSDNSSTLGRPSGASGKRFNKPEALPEPMIYVLQERFNTMNMSKCSAHSPPQVIPL